jgi:protein TonB
VYVNILVPSDIVPVKRVSPIRVKKRTVWREKPEGQPIERGREWMSDNLFVADSQASQLRGLLTGSCAFHVAAAVAVAIFFLTQAHRVPPLVKASRPLMMPAMLSFMPVAEAAVPKPAPKASTPSAPKPVPQPPAAAPPPSSHEEAPPPFEAPSTIAPDSASNDDGPHGVEGGVDGGVAGGTVGGVVGGAVGGTGGGPGGDGEAGAVRLGPGIEAPRKIKDVKPVYPYSAVVGQHRGTVIIEATVGADGKVHEAKVIRSVPTLDRAALVAVRQWEFLPARMNGDPIAVIVTVVVQFAIF